VNITSLPALLGIFALSFLVLLLAKVLSHKAEDRTAKQLLILLLIGMIAMAFCLFYIYGGMLQYFPRLSCIEIGLTCWIGPSLYFYVRRLNGGDSPFANKWNFLHWLPALLFELALVPFFLRPIGIEPAYPTPFFGRIIWFTWWFFHVQLLVYVLLCQPLLRLYRQKLVENFSNLSILNLRWLQFFSVGFIVVILSERLLPVLGITATALSQAAGMSVYLFIIALTYSALGQSRLAFAGGAQPVTAAPESPATEGCANGKYQRSGLRDDSAQYYLDKLNRLMAEERHYLDGDLSLQSLAERVRISPHHLSQMLNDKLGKNFYDYINAQRVEHAKTLLIQEPHKAVTDIAFASGYNSKNSFYNAFKRHAGVSPSAFREMNR
jgi:AraC-like DNA-binding protein